jgi:hypothetical protein
VPERHYYWNELSLTQIRATFAAHTRRFEAVHVRGLLCDRYGSEGLYDRFLTDVSENLFTFYLEK